MIKFFRNLRQHMIKENKVTKYLLYAIGEIVLVVIGILIALQINNNNEEKQRVKKEYEIMTNLIDHSIHFIPDGPIDWQGTSVILVLKTRNSAQKWETISVGRDITKPKSLKVP